MAVSGVIEHIELDKGLDMVDKAGVGGKKWISQKLLSYETKKNCYQLSPLRDFPQKYIFQSEWIPSHYDWGLTARTCPWSIYMLPDTIQVPVSYTLYNEPEFYHNLPAIRRYDADWKIDYVFTKFLRLSVFT